MIKQKEDLQGRQRIVTLFLSLIAHRIYNNFRASILVTSLFIVSLILSFNLEYKPGINATTILTLILFNTYYVGVMVVSMFLLWLYGVALSNRSRSALIDALLIILCGGLALASNPLFLIQFVAPLLLLGSTFLLTHDFRSKGIYILLTGTLSILAGYLFRTVFSEYTAATVNSYISFDGIAGALNALILIIREGLSNVRILLLWLFWLGLFLFHAAVFFIAIRRYKLRLEFDSILFHSFCILSPLITLGGVLLSGNYLTRYLIPVPFFTLVGAVIISPRLFKKNHRDFYITGVLTVATVLTYQSFSNISQETPNAVSNINCFSGYAKDRKAQFVGSFVTSRYLNLYAEFGTPIYQVNKELRPLNWLSNRYDHSKDAIDHVIVDKRDYPVLLRAADITYLGKPSSVHECHDFFIYRYEPHTIGYKLLNSRIRE